MVRVRQAQHSADALGLEAELLEEPLVLASLQAALTKTKMRVEHRLFFKKESKTETKLMQFETVGFAMIYRHERKRTGPRRQT